MNPLAIRRAGPGDVAAIDALSREAIELWGGVSIRSWLERFEYYALVADEGEGGLVGAAWGWATAAECEVAEVAVRADRRRQGIGTALVEALCLEARKRGALRAFLDVRRDNGPARALYERLGWREVGERRSYYRDGADAILYAIDLGPAGS